MQTHLCLVYTFKPHCYVASYIPSYIDMKSATAIKFTSLLYGSLAQKVCFTYKFRF